MVNFHAIAKKWQQRWAESHLFKFDEHSKKQKFYCLEMFPYPSAYGLHMGHVRNYTMGDVVARFKRMQGYNVLYPMGYDAFGLPAENAAIKNKTHPRIYTEKAIASIMAQQKELGNSYDWTRTIATCNPDYYKWNQWFFLKFYERGLVTRKTAPINWCPSCKTVLANEQVKDGKCWRCNSDVEIKDLEQWFIKITKYAEELLGDLKKLEGWPEKIRTMQENWIGKSTGTLLHFKVEGEMDVPVFTTRPDTLFGVMFLVFAPEHPKVMELVKKTKFEAHVQEFINKVVIEEKFTRAAEDKPKEGMFIGKYATHPLTGEQIPIYIANFVLPDYGTGCVMAVPAHDQRDFEFAKKYDIPMKQVIASEAETTDDAAYVGSGTLINSGKFDGMKNDEAKIAITKELELHGKGKATTQYKIRDWLVSRQRYWGTPIPMLYCAACGIVPVPEEHLPVLLPQDVEFTGQGNPLLTSESFVNTTCPKCKGPARRETDTMDTFFDSSWYFLRFCDPHNEKEPFNQNIANHLMPVDQYIGGAEHAVMHLLYARFFTKALRDMGLVKIDEPFSRLFNQGIVGKDGAKMSKSLGNVVSQDEISEKYGIDTARFYLMFIAAPESQIEWSDEGVQGSFRFLSNVFGLAENYVAKIGQQWNIEQGKNDLLESKRHRCIREVTKHIENFELNKAIIVIMEFSNALMRFAGDISADEYKRCLDTLAHLLLPFTPHIAEEMYERIGGKGFLSTSKWPQYDESLISDRTERDQEFIDETIANIRKVLQKNPASAVTLYQAQAWKYDFVKHFRKTFEQIKNPNLIAQELLKIPQFHTIKEDITKLTAAVYKNQKLLPLVDRTWDEEKKLLQDNLQYMSRELQIEVNLSDPGNDPKSRNGLPERPVIAAM